MKKITYTIGFAFAILTTSNAVAQQGFGTNRPDKSAAVEIKSPNKGLLIPRITLTSDTDVTTIVSPANSLLIYNETATNGLHAGYYYFNTNLTKWIPLLDSQYQNNTTVTQDGQNLSVIGSPTVNANGSTTTDYKVKITPGLDKQFLATYDDNGTLKTKWVSYGDIIEVTNGLTKTGNTIKLGGTLTEDTTLNTNGKKVMIQGLSTVADMTDQVIAVGHKNTGEVKVATPQQIVDKGLTHDLTSSVNTMKSTINGVDKTAPIINSNDLSIAANTTILTSTVNGVADTQDLKEAIQTGQIKYDVKSADASVTVTPTSVGDLTTFDLKVTNINAGILVGNGLSKETGTNRVVLGGDLDKETVINTNGNAVKIQGLTTVTDMTDQVIAVGHKNTGEVKVASPQQIVASGISADNGLKINATNPYEVNLGGALKEKTEIKTTATETLAISGLQSFTGAEKNVVVVDANGVLKTAAINTSNAIVTTAASLSLTDTHETILVDASAGNVTVTLPTAADGNKGKRYYVKLVATNTTNTNEVIISSLSKIDGDLTPIASSSPYQAWMLQSDGTAWFVVGN